MKSDDLRDEYDLAQLKDGVRRKYHQRAVSDTNLVLIEPDLVNRALRLLADTTRAATESTPKGKR
jgi:hypothetical protein